MYTFQDTENLNSIPVPVYPRKTEHIETDKNLFGLPDFVPLSTII